MYALQRRSVREFPDVVVISGDLVGTARVEEVARAVGRVLVHHEVVGGARVRLKTGRCGAGPMVVQVNLRVGDAPVRVQAVTSGLDDVLPALIRLDRHIERASAPWRPRPWPDLAHRILTVAEDEDCSGVVRRKQVSLELITPLRAAAVMDAMDYDAHLFTDIETGEDAVIYRAGPSGLRLARQHQVFPPGWSLREPSPPQSLIVNSVPALALRERQAVRRARECGLRQLFFTNPVTGRGRLLYPRYDGNLGLVEGVREPRSREG